jgi:hypothetical protein
MSVQAYKSFRFARGTKALIESINKIIAEYQAQGYVLTVRQVFYQLVSRDVIPNTMREYKSVAKTINDGRLAGLIDWDAIEDRTRAFVTNSRWKTPQAILYSAAQSFHMDMWATQPCRVYLIVEKEALVGVFGRICHQYDIPLLAARGYPSISVVREFAHTELDNSTLTQNVHLLHFGDHDPSGIDMSRDLQERIELIMGHADYKFTRCALNMDQIKEQKPPENPAKTTDSRFAGYKKKFGTSSWELDALQPAYLNGLVKSHVEPLIDVGKWAKRMKEIKKAKARLTEFADAWGK